MHCLSPFLTLRGLHAAHPHLSVLYLGALQRCASLVNVDCLIDGVWA